MEFKMFMGHPQSMQKLDKVVPALVFNGRVRSIQHSSLTVGRNYCLRGKQGRGGTFLIHQVLVKLS